MSTTCNQKVDFFGTPLEVGDFVVVAIGYAIGCHKILKQTPKMVRTASVTARTAKALKGELRYARDLVKIDPQLVTYHILKKTK